MLAPPPNLAAGDLADVLRSAWSIEPRNLAYAAVGFGSHHWTTDHHFVTVDEVDDAVDLRAALSTARALRDDAGLEYVIAAIPADDGSLVVPVGDEWVVHLYDRLDVVDDTTFGPHDDPEVLDLVRSIHDATPIAGRHANHEDFTIWDRDDLEEALADLDDPWNTGPYGERARRLLAANADDLVRLLAIHDQRAVAVAPNDWVVTHGEPHRGNIFRTTRGWAVVDWDTVLVAPAERDLWDLGGAGALADPQLADLYRLRWDLTEVAVYIAGFYDDHTGDADDERSWEGLVNHLDLRRRWPDLLGAASYGNFRSRRS